MAHESIQSKGKGMEIVSGTPSAAQYTALAARVTALETLVGGESSGLVKDVADLKTTVGDNTAGLVKRVADLESAAEAATGEG